MTCLSYPIRVENGKLAVTELESNKVSEAIQQSLLTFLEERIYVPEYGLDVEILEAVSSTSELEERIRQALEVGLDNYLVANIRVKAELLDDETKVYVFYDFGSTFDLLEEVDVSNT